MGVLPVPIALKNVIAMVGALAFALMAGLVIFAASIGHYVAKPSAEPYGDAGVADAIVVLTGGEARVQEGLRLFHAAKVKRILISGVNRQTTRDDLRRRTGLPDPLFKCCVDIGYSALDTRGNAAETRDWVEAWGFNTLLVVTSNYHMPRGLTELARALPDARLVPYPVISRTFQAEHWWMHVSTAKIVMSEYAKYLDAALRLGAQRLADWAEPRQTLRATVAASPLRTPALDRAAMLPR
jgi:uncharacterized SAM-binding protein YcdF (DUF218 family)